LPEKLSDNQIGDRLHAALELIGDAEGETTRGETTLKAARHALLVLQSGLVLAEMKGLDRNTAVIDPKKLEP
jgi:hypothetical protein